MLARDILDTCLSHSFIHLFIHTFLDQMSTESCVVPEKTKIKRHRQEIRICQRMVVI